MSTKRDPETEYFLNSEDPMTALELVDSDHRSTSNGQTIRHITTTSNPATPTTPRGDTGRMSQRHSTTAEALPPQVTIRPLILVTL